MGSYNGVIKGSMELNDRMSALPVLFRLINPDLYVFHNSLNSKRFVYLCILNSSLHQVCIHKASVGCISVCKKRNFGT